MRIFLADWRDNLPKILFSIAILIILALLPELGEPTFATDYYYNLQSSIYEYSAFVHDGRYLAEIFRYMTGKIFPPTLSLVLGMALVAACGILLADMMNENRPVPVVISTCILALHPIWHEIWAYEALRFTLPLALICAMLAVSRAVPYFIGILLIAVSANFYQAAIFAAIAAVCIASALKLYDGQPIKTVVAAYIVPKAGIVILGLVAYAAFAALMTAITGVAPSRLSSFATLPTSLGQIAESARLNVQAIVDVFFIDHFLFPASSKFAILALYLVAVVGFVARKKIVALFLLIIAAAIPLGAAWMTYPPYHMLSDRIIFPFAVVAAGIFLVACRVVKRRIVIANIVGGLVVAIFVFQANVRHQYMSLKNAADTAMASDIAAVIKANPDYRPGMPLVVYGTQTPDYLPFRLFPKDRILPDSTAFGSAFSMPWSADRMLMLSLTFSPATSDDRASTAAIAATLPVWPTSGSATIHDGRIILVLSH